jgi:MoxR-like ATPase
MSEPSFDQFSGTDTYIASDELKHAVNVAVALGRPLLVRGEPGTGKTLLSENVARALGLPLIRWHVKSTTKARDGLYIYDTVARLHDSRFGDGDVRDIERYIRLGPLGEALSSPRKVVLLIDEIDKADIEFPNDLLRELDRMEFHVHETRETIKAERRPVVVVTSNNEKELPDAFLRRCFFHYIRFPDEATMCAIVDCHHPDLRQQLVQEALRVFYGLREVPGLKKRPSTSELLDWIRLLVVEDDAPGKLRSDGERGLPPFLGALVKNEEDVQRVTQHLGRRR